MKQLNLYWLGKLDAFEATIAVTYPSGATCTCFNTSTGEEYTADTNPYTFTVHNAVTYTIRVTLDGVTKDSSVTITTNGQSESLTVSYGTINLTYTSDFQGVSLTCTDGTTTITKTAPSAGTTMVFYPPNTGSWTISGSVSGQSYSTTAVISSLSTPVSATLQTVPDGSTVLPTDDIQTWLACAGITNKSYTTLAEVLADSTTLSALIASENAVDYMVRSTTWAVAQALVPTMTSNTTPSGVASASSETIYAGITYYAYHAFDGSDTPGWSGNVNELGYIQYEFDSANVVNELEYKWLNQTYAQAFGYIIQASNDNFVSDSHDLKTGSTTAAEAAAREVIINFENYTAYKYYRLKFIGYTFSNNYCNCRELQFYSPAICENATAMSYIGLNNYCANTLLADSTWCNAICNSEYIDSVLNAKVPVMTGPTTPSGVVSVSGYHPSYPAYYQAFNPVTTQFWVSADNTTNQWIQYKFDESVKVKCMVYEATFVIGGVDYARTASLTLNGGSDGNTFPYTQTFTGVPVGSLRKLVVNNNDEYAYWRLVVNGFNMHYNADNCLVCVLNFYGRKDV